MKFKEVIVFSSKEHPTTPMVFYRDPDNLYIWFESGPNAWILTGWGWTLWPSGWSIAQVLASE